MGGDDGVAGIGAFSRRRLQGAALGAAAALAGARGALAWPGVADPVAKGAPADAESLFLSVDGLEPQEFAAGALRFARTETMPALEGLSLATISMSPRSARELHWHDNASELTHILSGSGVAIIVIDGARTVVPLEPGTLVFFPQGCAHALWNASDGPMEMVLGFDDPAPETINLSTCLPPVPAQVLAQTAGVNPGQTPFLPTVAMAFAVPLEGTPPAPTADAGEFAVLMDDVELEAFPGGGRRLADAADIPRLSGIKSTVLTLKPGAARLPHWHPHMDEIAYCLSGTVQAGVVGAAGEEQTAVLAPGDLAFAPMNWLHYLANVGEEEATVVLYHDAVPMGAIDLSVVLGAFPPELLAASFGLDGGAFAGLAEGGNPIIAAGVASSGS